MVNPFLLTDSLFLLLAIVMLILSILNLSLKSFKDEYFKETKENFLLTPIFDPTIKSPLASCPFNQEVIPLGEWKGTKTGCDCIGTSSWRVPLSSTDRYTTGVCTKDEFKGGCRTIGSSPPKNFTVWKGKEFCGAFGNQPYEEYLKDAVNLNETCKSLYHQCGIINSLNQKLCLPQEKRCPINKIVFSQSQTPPSDYKYKTLAFGTESNDFVYYTSEAITEPIIVKFKLSEGKICANPNQFNTQNAKEQFILDNMNYGCRDAVGPYIHDPRYVLLDKASKSLVFPENDIYNFFGTIRGFPQKYSPQTKKAEIELYHRNYIGLNMSCIKQFKLDQRSNDKVIQRNRTVENIHIAVCVLIALLIAFIIIVMLCQCCSDGYSKDELSISFYLLSSAYSLLLIPTFAMGLHCYIVFNKIQLPTTCGDDLFNTQLLIAQEEIDLNEAIDISIAAFCLVAVLMFIAVIIFLKRDSICHQTNSNVPIESNKEAPVNEIDTEEQQPLKDQDRQNSLMTPAPNNDESYHSTPLTPKDEKGSYQSGNYAI